MATKSQSNAAANHQRILFHLLNSVDENKYCCDCDAKGPRWASWNLGLFVCIRCAGIHRNLGVHISRVKSVNLDSWTAEQVQSVLRMGNKKAREIYEAQLPPGHRRPQEDYALEQFIRNKYDKKMYTDSMLLKEYTFEKVDLEKYLAKIGGSSSRSSAKSTTPIKSAAAADSDSKSTSDQSKSSRLNQNSTTPNSNPTAQKSNAVPPTSQSTKSQVAEPPMNNVDELLFFSDDYSVPSSNAAQGATVSSSHSSAVPSSDTAVGVNSNNAGDLAGLFFQPEGVNQNTTSYDLFGDQPNFSNNNIDATQKSNDTNKSTSGKKSTQDILSLYGQNTSANPFGGGGTGGNMAANPFVPHNNVGMLNSGGNFGSGVGVGMGGVSGPAAGTTYQWNQPIQNSYAQFNSPNSNINQSQPFATNSLSSNQHFSSQPFNPQQNGSPFFSNSNMTTNFNAVAPRVQESPFVSSVMYSQQSQSQPSLSTQLSGMHISGTMSGAGSGFSNGGANSGFSNSFVPPTAASRGDTFAQYNNMHSNATIGGSGNPFGGNSPNNFTQNGGFPNSIPSTSSGSNNHLSSPYNSSGDRSQYLQMNWSQPIGLQNQSSSFNYLNNNTAASVQNGNTAFGNMASPFFDMPSSMGVPSKQQ